MGSPPRLTPEQRQAILERARDVNHRRAELVKAITAGEVTVQDVFDRADHGDQAATRLKIRRLLRALPGVGPVKTGKWMAHAKITNPDHRVAATGSRQRRDLLDAIPDYLLRRRDTT